jgi:hypothetical protein
MHMYVIHEDRSAFEKPMSYRARYKEPTPVPHEDLIHLPDISQGVYALASAFVAEGDHKFRDLRPKDGIDEAGAELQIDRIRRMQASHDLKVKIIAWLIHMWYTDGVRAPQQTCPGCGTWTRSCDGIMGVCFSCRVHERMPSEEYM